MGLIHVMENLSDPSKLGAGIAVAFVATIYGVGWPIWSSCRSPTS
jgi:chemotaxis protein MotA